MAACGRMVKVCVSCALIPRSGPNQRSERRPERPCRPCLALDVRVVLGPRRARRRDRRPCRRRYRRRPSDRSASAGAIDRAADAPALRRGDRARPVIEHTYAGDYPFVVGGGVATFDCDSDGLPDMYVAGGAAPASMFRNRSEVGGALRFEAVADPITGMTAVTGAYPLDIDGDRVLDLVVLRIGEDVILRGLGDCRFERANEALSFPGGDGWTVGFSATWETPSSALPTLAFGDYLVGDGQDETTSECADDRLVRPASSGLTYGSPIALSPSYCTLVDAVQRLGSVRSTRPARIQRPPLLPRRRGAALADRGRPAAAAVRTGGWLAAGAHLGHGHRQPGRDRRSLSGGLSDEPGRQQAPDTCRRAPRSRATRTSRSAAASPRTGRMRATRRGHRRHGTRHSRTSTTTG